jgi:uncharacterized membrane protein (DUF485 family)
MRPTNPRAVLSDLKYERQRRLPHGVPPFIPLHLSSETADFSQCCRNTRMNEDIRALARARWRVAIALSLAVFALYFGFIFAVAFAKEAMARELVPGLSLGILLGALVIVGAWITTWIYVAWANKHFDAKLSALNGKGNRK